MTPHTDDPVDLLVDADPAVRLVTAMQLGEQRRRSAADALVERCGRERDFQVREALTWAVLRVQDTAMPLVRNALTSPRWLARLQASHTLSKLGLAQDAERLIPVIDDPVDCVAARAYWAAAQCGDPVAVPALVGQLGRGNAEHRNSLLVALSSFDDAAVEELVEALAHGATPAVRQHAADTLAYLGAPSAGPAEQCLRAALDDDAGTVRVAALNALGLLPTRSAKETIELHTRSSGRLGILARRLTDDGPPVAPLVSAPPQATPQDGGPVGRAWPGPDLSLVTLNDNPLGARIRPMLAEQVAVCRPAYLTRTDVPAHVLDDIYEKAEQEAIAAGRSKDRAARIAAGEVELFIHENVFHEQVAVADPGRTIDEILYGTGVKITHFERDLPPTPPNKSWPHRAT